MIRFDLIEPMVDRRTAGWATQGLLLTFQVGDGKGSKTMAVQSTRGGGGGADWRGRWAAAGPASVFRSSTLREALPHSRILIGPSRK